MRKRQFCTAPTLPKPRDHRVGNIVDGLVWLLGRQNADGSWGHGLMVDKVVCTCHVVMTLLTVGMSEDSPPIKLAVTWLTSAAVETHNNSYWILGPLTVMKAPPPVIIARELAKLETALANGAKPNAEQLVEAFYLRILAQTGRVGTPARTAAANAFIDSTYVSDQGWFGRPDSTTDGYAAYYEFDPPKALKIRDAVIKLLKDKTVEKTWGSRASTGYTLMNIVSTDLIDNAEVATLVDRAADTLLGSQKDGHWVLDNSPYGGAGDVTSDEYPTAVLVRALIAVQYASDPDYLMQIRDALAGRQLQASEVSASRRQRQLTWGLRIAAALALVFAFTAADDAIATLLINLFNSDFLRAHGTLISFGIGTTLAIVGVAVSLYPDQSRSVVDRILAIFRP